LPRIQILFKLFTNIYSDSNLETLHVSSSPVQ
jgi:hypothetical protein